jgi:5'-methylthioadenosine phosphorylase
MEGFSDVREVAVETPFGPPSDQLMVGQLEGRTVAFLPRHGRGHRIFPHELNFLANVFAMKKLGVEFLLSVSAVGSLKEEYAPLDVLVPDQLIDRTLQRRSTFFGRGLVAHVTYVCIEGPQFSTYAESQLYRSWGADVVGMTNLQEAKLAREAEICYATLAMVTDYDCWHPGHDAVTADSIMKILARNVTTARAVLRAVVKRLPLPRACECEHALRHALITPAELVPEAVKRELQPLVGRYLR